MLGVEVKDNESVERAINRFKKMVTRSRILNEFIHGAQSPSSN